MTVFVLYEIKMHLQIQGSIITIFVWSQFFSQTLQKILNLQYFVIFVSFQHFMQYEKLNTIPKYIYLFLYLIGEVGCSYCGGLGHRITDCPKLEALQTKQAQNIGRRDYLATGSADY